MKRNVRSNKVLKTCDSNKNFFNLGAKNIPANQINFLYISQSVPSRIFFQTLQNLVNKKTQTNEHTFRC